MLVGDAPAPCDSGWRMISSRAADAAIECAESSPTCGSQQARSTTIAAEAAGATLARRDANAIASALRTRCRLRTAQIESPEHSDMTTEPSRRRRSASSGTDGEIVARAGAYYRNTRYLMFVVMLGAAAVVRLRRVRTAGPSTTARSRSCSGRTSEAARNRRRSTKMRLAVESKKYEQSHAHIDSCSRSCSASAAAAGDRAAGWALHARAARTG